MKRMIAKLSAGSPRYSLDPYDFGKVGKAALWAAIAAGLTAATDTISAGLAGIEIDPLIRNMILVGWAAIVQVVYRFVAVTPRVEMVEVDEQYPSRD